MEFNSAFKGLRWVKRISSYVGAGDTWAGEFWWLWTHCSFCGLKCPNCSATWRNLCGEAGV